MASLTEKSLEIEVIVHNWIDNSNRHLVCQWWKGVVLVHDLESGDTTHRSELAAESAGRREKVWALFLQKISEFGLLQVRPFETFQIEMNDVFEHLLPKHITLLDQQLYDGFAEDDPRLYQTARDKKLSEVSLGLGGLADYSLWVNAKPWVATWASFGSVREPRLTALPLELISANENSPEDVSYYSLELQNAYAGSIVWRTEPRISAGFRLVVDSIYVEEELRNHILIFDADENLDLTTFWASNISSRMNAELMLAQEEGLVWDSDVETFKNILPNLPSLSAGIRNATITLTDNGQFAEASQVSHHDSMILKALNPELQESYLSALGKIKRLELLDSGRVVACLVPVARNNWALNLPAVANEQSVDFWSSIHEEILDDNLIVAKARWADYPFVIVGKMAKEEADAIAEVLTSLKSNPPRSAIGPIRRFGTFASYRSR